MTPLKSPGGFTIIELLVVIGIIAILAALIFPALGNAREKANRTRCLANLKQVAVAARMQFDDLGNRLPVRGTTSADCVDWGVAAEQLLPYVSNDISVFDCPSNPGIRSPDSYRGLGPKTGPKFGQKGTYGEKTRY